MATDDGKKDSKKKNTKGREGTEISSGATDSVDLSRLVAGLHDRINALSFEITGLRGDIVGTKGGKGKRSATTSKPAFGDATPDALLSAVREQAQTTATESGTVAVSVVTAIAQSPVPENTDGDDLLVTTLRFVPDAVHNNATRAAEEGALSERAARIAASLGSDSRIVIARLLLTEPTLTATELGTGADLTTGSLYHHLREMTHAGVLTVEGRNRYALSPTGRRALLFLLALSSGSTPQG